MSVGNEPQFPFQDNPNLNASDFLVFYRAVVEHAHSVSDKVAMTLVLAASEETYETPLFTGIIDSSDIASLNLYGGKDSSQWLRDLDQALHVAGKPLVLQEMGLSTRTKGLNQQLQVEYIETMGAALRNKKLLRAYFWFLVGRPLLEWQLC